jgi:hypothetical protein
MMYIDIILHDHHLLRIQTYHFIPKDCLFNSIAFLLHHFETLLEFCHKCMIDFAKCLQHPSKSFQDKHFNASLLLEDHEINVLQCDLDKMVISENCEC